MCSLPTKRRLHINRFISSAFHPLLQLWQSEVTYSHRLFSVLQRFFFQFSRDLIRLARPFRLRHKEKKQSVKLAHDHAAKNCRFGKPPTISLPLQTTASMLLGNPAAAATALSINGGLAAWPSWLDGCRPEASRSSRGPPGSGTCRGGGLSLRTVILMQLPAFLRALTASWWVAPCMSRPLTWRQRRAHGRVRHQVSLK